MPPMFKAEFNTDTAAFDNFNFANECSSILQKIAKDIEHGKRYDRIMDVNGHRVGSWLLTR